MTLPAALTERPADRIHIKSAGRILELDGLRAIAILLVLGCHYPGFAIHARMIPSFGWIGVDIFFVLSGYLITTILLGLRERTEQYRTFYSRRFIRILPPYLAVTLFLFVIAVHGHWKLPNYLASQLLFLQAASQQARQFAVALVGHPRFYLTHLAPLSSNAHKLPPALMGILAYGFAPTTYWSLSIEEYFYLFWAPVVLLFSRRSIVIIALVVCLAEALLRWMDGSAAAYFSLFCRFDTLLIGALLALLFERWRRTGTSRSASRQLLLAGAAALLGLIAILQAIRPIIGRDVRGSVLFIVLGLPLLSVCFAAFIGLILLSAGTNAWLARFFRMRILLFIGTISYTMYLVHIIAAATVFHVVNRFDWRWSSFGVAVASTLLTILISYASWHWMEKPLLRWKDRRFPNAPHPAEPRLG